MNGKTVLFVLLDQYADWEAAPLAAAVNTAPGLCVKTVAPGGRAVRSIGGFTAMPDGDIPSRLPEDCAGVVLIGGMSWRTEAACAVEAPVRDALARHLPLGAICDATVYLGTLGVLNDIPHTSNMLPDLQAYAGACYTGEKLYRAVPVVRSGRIVTANGTADMDFAREMLVALDCLTEEEAGKWYRLFKFGFYEASEEAAWWFARLS